MMPRFTAVLATAVFFHAAPARAADWAAVLVSGGGSPAANAVAHEKNILFVQRALRGAGLAPADLRAYVSVGHEPAQDVAMLTGVPPGRWELGLLDRLFGSGNIDLTYRRHGVSDAAGPARRAEVMRALDKAARGLKPGATLLLYTTDHGRKNEADLDDNAVVLWGNDELAVEDVRLALAPQKGGRFVGVFAQCYSGAFANLVFEKKGSAKLAAADRCGFFAATPDREAAGCTPELDEADYDDYTTRVFAALSGVERTGKRAPGADYDQNGHVSFAEAHAYAVGSEETVDVPVKTSEFFLERRGVRMTAAWGKALAAAPAAEQAAWRLVAARLRLSGGDPEARIGAGLRDVRKRAEAARQRLNEIDGALEADEELLRQALLERWPVIGVPYHPDFAATLGDGKAVRDFLAGQPAFARWRQGSAGYAAVSADLGRLQVEEAWWLRAERLRRHVVRLASADRSLTADLTRLQACENAAPGR